MTRYAALLRGVNLGPNRKVPMADLRAVHEGLGHREVRTYIQSGNVVFDSPTDDPAALRSEIEEALAERFGMEIRVVLRTHAELQAVVASGPYADLDIDPRFVAVTFLDVEPEVDPATRVDSAAFAPDEFVLIGREIHQLYPTGMGRSKLPAALGRAIPGLLATTRNWRTVTKLAEMSAPG